MSGPTLSSVTLSSNNITVNWTTPDDYNLAETTVYLLQYPGAFDGSNPPSHGSVAVGTLANGYSVSLIPNYAISRGNRYVSYYHDPGTYTIGGLPPITSCYVLVLCHYIVIDVNNNSSDVFVGQVWQTAITVPKINTTVSIPDLISVATNDETFIKFTNKASLYNGTYPATSYIYYASDINTGQTKTVTVQPTLDSYGNQYFAWTIAKSDNGGVNSILLLGRTYQFSFSATYTDNLGKVNISGQSDIAGPYTLAAKNPDQPRNLQAVFSKSTSYTGSLYGVEPSSVILTWDADSNTYADPATTYKVLINVTYLSSQFNSSQTPGKSVIQQIVNVDANYSGNKLIFDATKLYGVNPDSQVAGGYSYALFEHYKSYSFSVTAIDSNGHSSPTISTTATSPAPYQPRPIQSVSRGVAFLPSYDGRSVSQSAISLSITLQPDPISQYSTPTYFLACGNDGTVFYNTQTYQGFPSYYSITYDSSGYIKSSTVYIKNVATPVGIRFGVIPVYVYYDENNQRQVVQGNPVYA